MHVPSQAALPIVTENEDKRTVALVTGASGGIGLELARLLAADGWNLALLGRSTDRLAGLAAELSRTGRIRARPITCDLSRPDAPGLAVRAAEAAGPVEILVNNAGFGMLGDVARLPPGVQLEMIQVNVLALTHLTRLVLPGMLRRGSGRILNVASTAAFQPGPHMAVYYASKAFVLSFSLALSEELRGTGVTVTALCPGPTWTGFQQRAGLNDEGIGRLLAMRSRPVAAAGYRALMRGAPLVVPGIANRILAFMTRWAPRPWVARVAGWHNAGRKAGGREPESDPGSGDAG